MLGNAALRQLEQACERLIGVARAGDWEGDEIPNPVAAEIAHIAMLLDGRLDVRIADRIDVLRRDEAELLAAREILIKAGQ